MSIELKVRPTAQPITCIGKDKCSTCRIGPNGSGFCPGCNGHCSSGTCVMASCHRDCMKCGGGEAAPNSTPAICCKSPIKDLLLDKVERDSYNFTRRPRIPIKQQGIIVTQGSVGARVKDPYPPEIEAIAVNIRHVWSRRGWYSKDMKDYLKLPKEKKLILLTMTLDPVLENAWNSGVHEEDPSEYGFDYWQPLNFSQYYDDAKMNMYYQWRRTLIATERSKAWFTASVPWLMTRKADEIVGLCAKEIPQVIFNAQFIGNEEALKIYLKRLVVRTMSAVPKGTPFWFVGLSSRKYIHAVKNFLADRPCYFMATQPWLAGHKGTEYTTAGKTVRSTLPKDELVIRNQRAFISMVESL